MSNRCISSGDLGYVIRQTMHGESLGLVILKRIHELSKDFGASPVLLKAIETQISDEKRHVKIYRDILKSRRYGRQHQLNDAWDNTLSELTEQGTALHILAIGVYGCIEPFNLEVVENILLPRLEKAEYFLVKEVSADEKTHINILDLFDELFSKNLTKTDIDESHSYSSKFSKTFLGGMSLPSGEPLIWSQEAKRNFLSHFRGLKTRIAEWA